MNEEGLLLEPQQLESCVRSALAEQPVWDMHTHLFAPSFGSTFTGSGGDADPKGLLLWGVDELLTYHYLVAEVFRVVPANKLPYEDFWRMSKSEQADHIWRHLFIASTPLSEACRGVVTTLSKLGLDPNEPDLAGYRTWFSQQDPSGQVDRVMQLAGVSRITMTNEAFDENEHERWLADPSIGDDPRFAPVLRFDALLGDWPTAASKLTKWGYPCGPTYDAASRDSVTCFLEQWIERTKAIYCAVSLPPHFRYTGSQDTSHAATVLREAVLPTLAARGLPFAMMIGAKRGVNPPLRDGGDALGYSDVDSVSALCRDFPQNRFFCTMLARENQHALAVAARKFGNLMVFGCWWFLNNPSLIEEITRMRMELLGPTYIPQHSDARVLEQLLYKWDHSRGIIAKVLIDKYRDLIAAGWRVTRGQVKRDAEALLYGNFAKFLS